MAQTIEAAVPAGIVTPTAKLYAFGSATALYTASGVVEDPSNVATATFSGVTPATYRLVIFEAGTGVAEYKVDVTASGVFQAYDYHPGTASIQSLAEGSTGFAAIDTVVDTINTNVGTAGAGLTNIGTIATVTNLTNLPTIPTDWLTADGTAADFTTEIQAGIADQVWDEATSEHVTTGTTGKVLDQFVFTVANQVDANTLTQTAGIVIAPNSVSRSTGTTLNAYVGENVTFPPLTPTDVDGTTLDTTAITLEVIIENKDKTDVVTIADGSITKTATTIQFASTTAANTSEAIKRWSVRRTDTDVVVGLHGEYVVEYAATGD